MATRPRKVTPEPNAHGGDHGKQNPWRPVQTRSPRTLHPVHFAHAITAQLITTVANRMLSMYAVSTVRLPPICPSASEHP